MADKNEKRSWTSRQTKYTVGGGLGGLLAGILLRRFIDGDKKTALKDYLLWGGLGTALGAGGGYLAGTDRKLSKSDKEYLQLRLDQAKKDLKEAEKSVKDIENKKGYNNYWGMSTELGSAVQGTALASGVLGAASLASSVPTKGKVGAFFKWVPAAGDSIIKKYSPHIMLGTPTVLGAWRKGVELTDSGYQKALEQVDKLKSEVDRNNKALQLFGQQ